MLTVAEEAKVFSEGFVLSYDHANSGVAKTQTDTPTDLYARIL